MTSSPVENTFSPGAITSAETDVIKDEYYIHVASKVIATCTAVITMLLGSYGNIRTLVSVTKSKMTRLENFIAQLAVIDVIICVLVCPLYVYILYDDKKEVCLSWTFMVVACGTVSVGTLDLIAMNRQGRVLWHKPHYAWGQGRIVCMFLSLWTVGLLLAVGAMLSVRNDNIDHCNLVNSLIALFLAPVYFISLLIILCSYTKVAVAVVKQSKLKKAPAPNQQEQPSSADDNHPVNDLDKPKSTVEIPSPQDSRVSHISIEKEARALCMCFVVVITVLCTWNPFIVSCIIALWKGESFILTQVKVCGGAFLLLNSACHPFIYSGYIIRRGMPLHASNDNDNSFGCLGWRCNKKKKMKVVVKVNDEPEQHLAGEVVSKLQSGQAACCLVDVAVGPSGPQSHRVFTVLGASRGLMISSSNAYPQDSFTSDYSKRRSTSSITYSHFQQNSVNAEVSSVSQTHESVTFMDFCRDSSWSNRSHRVVPYDNTSGRF